MKYIKKFENMHDTDSQIVKCNWCDWYGTESDLNYNKYDEEECPGCGNSGFIMTVDLDEMFGDGFKKYVKNNKPEINKKTYDDIEDYYISSYPMFFTAKKYNL